MSAKRYLFYISQNYSYAILRPLQAAILARGDEAAWFLEGTEVNSDFLEVGEHQLLSIDAVIQYEPEAVFYPANIAPTFLPGINVAIFHGFDAGKLDKKGENDHFKIRNCFELYCTQGPNTTSPFLQLSESHAHFKVVETGWCALDRLYSPNKPKEIKTAEKSTILMCSTFSKRLSCAPDLFERVKQLSETGKWQWIVQFHPKMNKDIVQKYKSLESEHLTFVETDDVIPLLQQADVMLCDTSSVLIMFILQGKPVVTYKNIAPKNYLLDFEDDALLETMIDKALSKPIDLIKNIDAFIQATHPYNDGLSAQRVLAAVDEVVSKKSTLGKKPVDFFRQFKMRHRLGYWKFW